MADNIRTYPTDKPGQVAIIANNRYAGSMNVSIPANYNEAGIPTVSLADATEAIAAEEERIRDEAVFVATGEGAAYYASLTPMLWEMEPGSKERLHRLILGDALAEVSDVAPGAPLEARIEAADAISDALSTEFTVFHYDRNWNIADYDTVTSALENWDVEATQDALMDIVSEHAAEVENDIEADLVVAVDGILEGDVDDSERVPWAIQELQGRFGYSWNYDESDWMTSNRRSYGIVDENPCEIGEAYEAIKRCNKGDHMRVESLEDLELITSVLPEGGVLTGFPKPVKVANHAKDEFMDWIENRADFADDYVGQVKGWLGLN